MLTSRAKVAFSRLCEPPARVLVRLGLSPSTITILGLCLLVASCVWLLATRNLLLFCLLATVTALFDALDGTAARLSGRVTKFGAYLDAVCDRYGEAVVVFSVAVVTGYWTLSVIVLAGAMLVSYAKARTAMEVSIANLEWPDLMERTERGVIYIVGLAAGQVLPVHPLGHDLFWWTLALLSVLIHATVVQRILRARCLIASRSET